MDIYELINPARLTTNLFAYLCITVFIHSALIPRKWLPPWSMFILSYAAILGCSASFILIYDHFILKMVVVPAAYTLVTKLFYQDSLPRRLFVSIFQMIVLTLAEGLASVYIIFIKGVSMPMEAGDEAFTFSVMPVMLLCYTVCFGISSLLFYRKTRQLTFSRDFYFLLILPLSHVVLMGAFFYAYYISNRQFLPMDALVTVVIIILSLLSNFVFFRMLESILAKKRMEEEKGLMERYYSALIEQQKTVRSLRHDIANHLTTVNVLMDEDPVKAARYLSSVSEKFQETRRLDRCDHPIADAVIYSKLTYASTIGVSLDSDAILPRNIGIDELDLMSLLSNLLDNAIDAAAKSDDKLVQVRIRSSAGTVLCKVRNSVSDGKRPNLSKTTKAAVKEHGYGIGIIRDICNKYNGTYQVSFEDGMFETSVMLIEQSDRK